MKTQENQISYTLPDNWTDLDKLYLCHKVLMHDGVFSRASSYKNYDDAQINLMANIITAVEQAIITLPPIHKGDLHTKLTFLQYLLTSDHLDNSGHLIFNSIDGTALSACEIAKQLDIAIDGALTDNQRKKKDATHQE